MLVVLLCVSLCSCNTLDKMRAARAVIREDGAILWNNAEYRPLPIQDDLVWERYELIFDRGGTFFVTTEEVPVLLSEKYGYYGSSYNVGTILNAYHGEVPGVTYYCLSSQYESITKELESIQALLAMYDSGISDSYYYKYWYEENGDSITQTYYLNDEQMQAVNTVLTTVDPIAPEEPIGMIFNVILYDNAKFEHYFEANLAMTVTNDYYLSDVNGEYGKYYIVPEEYNQIFDGIFSAKWEALGIDTENWPLRDEQKGE